MGRRILPRRSVTAFPAVLREFLRQPSLANERERLEDLLRERIGCRLARLTPSGREGLSLLLRSLPSRVPRRAYVPGWTIEAVPEILRAAGFEVLPLDVDPGVLSVTPDLLRKAWRGPGVALITHYFGLPADMPSLMPAAQDLGIDLLEDCAHAPLATAAGQAVGTFGRGGFYSFESRKPLNGMGGGLVFSADAETAARLKALPLAAPSAGQDLRKLLYTTAESIAWQPGVLRWLTPLLYRSRGRQALVGLYRRIHASSRSPRAGFSDLQARLVALQLDRWEETRQRKARLARRYRERLPASFVQPLDPPDRPHVWYMFVVRHPRAPEMGEFLRRHGIDCGIGPEVLPLCADPRDVPGSAEAARTALEIPMHDALSEADVDRVCEVAARFR